MNKKTSKSTTEQYKKIIDTVKMGFNSIRPNQRIATILFLEAALKWKISDIVSLRLDHIEIKNNGNICSFEIMDKNTSKIITQTFDYKIYQIIQSYCQRNNIKPTPIEQKNK